jgi:glucosamine 6-phosphate synthetase-like amidotransferase/phosphosugar isomerase protein
MIFKDLIQVFSVQLNLIFLIVIYNQQNKIDSLIDNIKEVEEKIDKYHNEFENIMKLNDNVIEKSEELTNYLNFYPSSRILLLISSVMFILKLIKVYQSTL